MAVPQPVQDVGQKAQNWFLTQELPQLIRMAAAFAAGHATSDHALAWLAHYGITIDPTKFSASIETWGMGIVAALLAHYGINWVGAQASAATQPMPPLVPPAPPAPPAA